MMMQRDQLRRYVFIGGLHRSGTSFVNRIVNALPGAGGITNAPVPENEGVYLQGAIPHTARSGRPMEFATNPAEHFTEDHPLNSLETRQRLEYDWDPWFAPDLRWRVEKSPVNLTRMRLLQQLFPLSQFIVVLRHPEVVAASVASWVDAPAMVLHQHWIAAHAQLLRDLPYLHAVMCLRYEDVVARPAIAQGQIAAFLDCENGSPPEYVKDGNAPYHDAAPLDNGIAEAVAEWGYRPHLEVRPYTPIVQHPLRAVRDVVRAMDV